MGINKFKEYIKKFNYGNEDISGYKGQNNQLTTSWISSSLEISPKEQITFLKNLIENKLPVSIKALEMTKKILFSDELANGWKLYEKTGGGSVMSLDKTKKLDRKTGWFIGWAQKDKRVITFVHYIEDEDKQDTYASPRAKVITKEKLMQIIQEL